MYYNNRSETFEDFKRETSRALEKNPSLINDTNFLLKNLPFLEKNLTDFSSELRSNELFLYDYFAKCYGNKKDYQFITENLLNNSIFICVALEKNPDIYLLLKEDQKKEEYFKVLEKYHNDEILKYVTKEQLNNLDYCYKKIQDHSENYQFSPDASKIEERVLRDVFMNVKTGDDSILRYIKYLPAKQKEDSAFNEYLLKNIQINLFPYISSIHRDNPSICKQVLAKKPNYFKYVSSKLKADKNFIHDLLYNTRYEDSSRRNNYYGYYDNQLTSKQIIISLLPIEHFTKEFCETFKEDLSKCFPELPSSHRKELHIIKAALSGFKDDEKVGYNFESLIGIKEIRHAVKEYTNKEKRGTHVFAFLNSYLLTKELDNTLTHHSPKMKI